MGPGRELGRLATAQPAAPASALSLLTLPGQGQIADVTVYVPTSAQTGPPVRVLLALHGMGGNGAEFSRPLREVAAERGWVLVAPTINYRDWSDPEQVRLDGADVLPSLRALIDDLPSRLGLSIENRVLLYGFSRGGQSAHRFALFYPEAVAGVASFSCGTYTLPTTRVQQGADETVLKFPYGVGDLERYRGKPFDPTSLRNVNFWLGVGERDNVAAELPRQWDPYLGTTRVDRARAFTQALEQVGASAQLEIFPNAAHEITSAMRDEALAFLSSHDQPVAFLGSHEH